MVRAKKIEKKEAGDWHVRYRPASQFTRIRTPTWASNVADSVSRGADVRVGRTPAGSWLTQSVVLEPEGIRDANHARSLGSRIQKKVDE